VYNAKLCCSLGKPAHVLAKGGVCEHPVPDHSRHPKVVHDLSRQDAHTGCCLLELKALLLAVRRGIIHMLAVLMRLQVGKAAAVVDTHVHLQYVVRIHVYVS
jgi:hypothetical protein